MAKFSRVGPVMINAEVHVVILGEKSFSQDGSAFISPNPLGHNRRVRLELCLSSDLVVRS